MERAEDLPTRNRRLAKGFGGTAFALLVASIGVVVLGAAIGSRWNGNVSQQLFMLAPVCAGLSFLGSSVGTWFYRRCLNPRPVLCVVSLAMSFVLLALYAYAGAWAYGMGHMH